MRWADSVNAFPLPAWETKLRLMDIQVPRRLHPTPYPNSFVSRRYGEVAQNSSSRDYSALEIT